VEDHTKEREKKRKIFEKKLFPCPRGVRRSFDKKRNLKSIKDKIKKENISKQGRKMRREANLSFSGSISGGRIPVRVGAVGRRTS